jgi:hypothetical protein
MVSSWVLSRFRSAWLSQNLTLVVLRLLRESRLSEWEILSRLHTRYGLNPSAREFERLEKELLGEGFALVEPDDAGGRLSITASGLKLLRALEEGHRDVVSSVARPRGSGSGQATR